MSDDVITLDDARAECPNFDEVVADLAATRGYSWSAVVGDVLAVMQPVPAIPRRPESMRPSQPMNRHERRRRRKLRG